MRKRAYLVGLVCAAAILSAACAADGPPGSAAGKLFGFMAPHNAPAAPELAAAYEKSGATAAFLSAEWGACEPNDPGSGASAYDFSAFDAQPLAKSAKTRVCWISLANSWADKIRTAEPERYWKLAEAFVTELVKHANAMGIKHFAVKIEQDRPESSVGPTVASVEPLKHVYSAVKAVSNDNVVIAEQPYGSGANAIEILYRIGAKGSFDVAAVRAVAKAGGPIDPFALVAARRELARSGEGKKQLLIIGGWEPTEASGETPWPAIQAMIARDYRNILTERDIYDPAWVLGEIIHLPETPPADFIAAFPPKLPEVKLQAQLQADTPIFAYVTEKPYKLALTITNLGSAEMKPGKFGIALRGDRDMACDWRMEGQAPTTIAAGAGATAEFTVTLPKESDGRQVTLVASVDYTIADEAHAADAWLTLIPTPQYEVTILPSRLVLDPRDRSKQVGMSVINHTDVLFDGKITLTPYPGIVVKPTEFVTKIDPLGLEGFAFNVSAEQDAAPGRYAVLVDVGGKAKDWQAVDVALVAKKAPRKIVVNGILEDFGDAASFTPASVGPESRPRGKGWIAYDDEGLYLGLELAPDPGAPQSAPGELREPADSLFLGLDTLLNGAKTAAGGYKEDDYEFEFTSPDRGGLVKINQAPDPRSLGENHNVPYALGTQGGKLYYEIMIPWSVLAPLKPTKGTSFALALQRDRITWGGGLAPRIDPRMFVPVILAE